MRTEIVEKYHGLPALCSTESTHTSGCGGLQDCHQKGGGEQVLFYLQTYNRSLSEGQMTNHNEANRKA